MKVITVLFLNLSKLSFISMEWVMGLISNGASKVGVLLQMRWITHIETPLLTRNILYKDK